MPTARSGPPAFRGRPVYRGYVERPNASGIVGTATTLHATRLVELASHATSAPPRPET
ncbi:hypothetical protein ACIQC7_34710 [Kitasatospora sp. NPDC088556]|uniref:hypothetical protein n=1 Tax=Kitasatospora sp. NPDC088556 TaxID=3364076 RepID=UPI003822DF86